MITGYHTQHQQEMFVKHRVAIFNEHNLSSSYDFVFIITMYLSSIERIFKISIFKLCSSDCQVYMGRNFTTINCKAWY